MQKIKDLRAYVAMACAMMLSAINSAPVANVEKSVKDQFTALEHDIDIHLTGIEQEIAASQSASTPTSILAPARQWHHIVLAAGIMFTIGLILGAALGMPGALS